MCSIRVAFVLVLLVPVGSTQASGQSWLRVEVAAGGGFAGTPGTTVVSRPAVDCDANNVCVAVPGQIDLFADSRRVWRPALATGVVVRVISKPKLKEPADTTARRFGVGIGGQMVFTTQAQGTRLLPALTLHLGNRTTQLFGGLLFGSFDKVVFPNGAESIRVDSDDQPNFVKPDADSGPGVFLGVVIDGVAVTK
jgi:hypothetical protein